MNSEKRDTLAGLDIGSTKIAVCVGHVTPQGELEVTGIGSAACEGVHRGMVINIDATVESVRTAVAEAERMSGQKVTNASVSIGGQHIKSINSQGNSPIRSEEVTELELELALESAKAIPLNNDETIVHVIPQEYVIDWQEGIREPLGMSGTRLDATVHVVTCAKNVIRNVVKCVTQCNIAIAETVVEPLASAASVLSSDECELGVCLLDIGGGTTGLAVYVDGAIQHTQVIPMAGGAVTKDIAMTFRTPAQNAEEIKTRYACALQDLTDDKESIRVMGVADRPASQLPRQTLAAVVESRYRELFSIVRDSLNKAQISLERLGSGVVLTGGAAAMEGAVELAEEVFHLPVACGKPTNLAGLSDFQHNTTYATCTGLLVWSNKKLQSNVLSSKNEQINGSRNPVRNLRNWIRKTF